MTNTNRNEYVASEKLQVPGVENAMQQLKLEIASELGLHDYDNMDKGELTSRQNGRVGGLMTKRLVELGEQMLEEQHKNKLN